MNAKSIDETFDALATSAMLVGCGAVKKTPQATGAKAAAARVGLERQTPRGICKLGPGTRRATSAVCQSNRAFSPPQLTP